MIVTATSQAVHPASGDLPREGDRHDAPAHESRALVVLATAAGREPAAGLRLAPFLAQLIANRDQLPQTRERRRAEPGEAIAAYRATAALTARH